MQRRRRVGTISQANTEQFLHQHPVDRIDDRCCIVILIKSCVCMKMTEWCAVRQLVHAWIHTVLCSNDTVESLSTPIRRDLQSIDERSILLQGETFLNSLSFFQCVKCTMQHDAHNRVHLTKACLTLLSHLYIYSCTCCTLTILIQTV
jgi:hypothetical protein